MWVHLNHVHVHVLSLVDLLASDDIAHINDAIIALIGVVVEPDVLRVVIRLVDQEQL